ncbi:MAG: hypothetical protein JKY37_24060 [Nannocystaceae bacterium]|nr:hypothetical protein [Nannocystaceae bacterium]
MSVFELDNASFGYAHKTVVSGVDWKLGERSVGVLFGGGGTGKSSFLRSLTGVRVAGFERAGTWRFCGDPHAFDAHKALSGVVWCGQPPRDFEPKPGRIWPALDRALSRSDARVLLLDEPNAWVHEDTRESLVRKITTAASQTSVLLSTHHVEFGRACADRVTLLGGGRVLVDVEKDDFFSPDAHEDAQMFIRTGNAVPRSVATPLPAGLRWVLPDRLGGMGIPGATRDAELDLAALAANGVTHLVTLTRTPLGEPRPVDFGMEWHHFAIVDMGVPTMRAALRIASQIQRWLSQDAKVVVHCRGGMGRTGLVLALAMVQLGHNHGSAIDHVRGVNHLYIQTPGQLRFVAQFEEELRPPADGEDDESQ